MSGALGALVAAAAGGLPQSAEISPLFQGIQSQGVEETIQPQLEGLTKAEKAAKVVEMIGQREQQAEVIRSIVDHLWRAHVVPHELWEHYDGGEEKFMEDVDFAGFVQPTLDAAAQTRSRKARELSTIHPIWGQGWEKVIEPDNWHLSILSEKYMGYMAYLARNGIGLHYAQQLLCSVRNARLSNPHRGVPTIPIVTVGDAKKLTDAFKKLSRSRNISPAQCTAEDLQSELQVAAPGTVIPRITELESPAATPISHPPAGLLAAQIPGITLQLLPQIYSPNETKQKLAILTISAWPLISVNPCREQTSLVEHTKLRRSLCRGIGLV